MLKNGISLKLAGKLKFSKEIFSVPFSRLYNYAKYKMREPLIDMKLSYYGPVFCALLLTARCNLSCKFCIVKSPHLDEGWRDLEADVDKVKRILDHPAVKTCLLISLTGGEPLLNESIYDIIRLIRHKGHLVTMSTNGILLEEKITRLKASGINLINVSLYKENMDLLSDALPRVNRIFRCRANKLLERSEIEEYPENIERAICLAKDTGCEGIYLANYLTKDVSMEEVIYDDNPRYKDLRDKFSERYKGFPIYWGQALKRRITAQNKKCRMPWYFLPVDMSGNMGVCCRLSNTQKGLYGNLFEGGSEGALNTDLKRRMRRALISKDDDIPSECQGCSAIEDPWIADI